MANLFARREAKTRIRQRYWLKLAGEKIRREREQVRTVPTFLSVRATQIRQVKNRLNITLLSKIRGAFYMSPIGLSRLCLSDCLVYVKKNHLTWTNY